MAYWDVFCVAKRAIFRGFPFTGRGIWKSMGIRPLFLVLLLFFFNRGLLDNFSSELNRLLLLTGSHNLINNRMIIFTMYLSLMMIE